MTRTPQQLGFRMPAEWAVHASTWLSWPHEETTWPAKLPMAEGCMARWVRELTRPRDRRPGEPVDINVLDEAHGTHVAEILTDWSVDMASVRLHLIPTADVWIRDYGPIFVTRTHPHAAALLANVVGEETGPDEFGSEAIVAWDFDAWGGKGAQYYGDNQLRDRSVARRIGEILSLPVFAPGMVLEGGGIEVNGRGTLMAAQECLLEHRARAGGSAEAARGHVEQKLHDYLGVDHFIWVNNVTFEGDDTDGHIDNLSRFVGPHSLVTAVAYDRSHPLYRPLQDNLRTLERQRTETGHPVEVIPIPLPSPFHYRWQAQGRRQWQQFPASYMNFYIANNVVLVPVYADEHDTVALDLLARCFPSRAVVPIDCCDYILGQGAIHCSTQQRPRSNC